ncbi:hypothetical protein B0A55_10908 [Friedmanniomyces simplex]|uniref:Myb-like domain-containing protein n=1 Tax=Friedmanniomyces simplex TaxID=329884 RepID=A0A4V5NFM5_9PEZI|nr:hypothetical protein B0A55_10908 [Friedmanniomyces simplex]
MAAIKLTAPQYKLLGAVVDTMNASIDWKAVADKAGYENAKKARDPWYTTRDKLTATLDADEKPNVDLTPAQKELLGAVIDTMNASIDWTTVATKTGHETAKKARDPWYTIRKKFTATVGGGEKASRKKRKAGEATGDEEAGNDEAGEEAAPAKKTKGAAKKKKTDEDAGDEAPPPKKAKAVRKKAARKTGKKGKKAATPDEDGVNAEEAADDHIDDGADAEPEQGGDDMFA